MNVATGPYLLAQTLRQARSDDWQAWHADLKQLVLVPLPRVAKVASACKALEAWLGHMVGVSTQEVIAWQRQWRRHTRDLQPYLSSDATWWVGVGVAGGVVSAVWLRVARECLTAIPESALLMGIIPTQVPRLLATWSWMTNESFEAGLLTALEVELLRHNTDRPTRRELMGIAVVGTWEDYAVALDRHLAGLDATLKDAQACAAWDVWSDKLRLDLLPGDVAGLRHRYQIAWKRAHKELLEEQDRQAFRRWGLRAQAWARVCGLSGDGPLPMGAEDEACQALRRLGKYYQDRHQQLKAFFKAKRQEVMARGEWMGQQWRHWMVVCTAVGALGVVMAFVNRCLSAAGVAIWVPSGAWLSVALVQGALLLLGVLLGAWQMRCQAQALKALGQLEGEACQKLVERGCQDVNQLPRTVGSRCAAPSKEVVSGGAHARL